MHFYESIAPLPLIAEIIGYTYSQCIVLCEQL